MEAMQPFLNAIVKPDLLRHQDRDVKLLVATCICEITRITAPEAPYSDDVLKVHIFYQGYCFNEFFLSISSRICFNEVGCAMPNKLFYFIFLCTCTQTWSLLDLFAGYLSFDCEHF